MTFSAPDPQMIAQLQATIARLEQENRKLKRLISVDPLTQVANRKAFEQRLYEEWKRARRSQSAISLLLLNVDEQCAGSTKTQHSDVTLQRLAFMLSRIPRRSTDLFARYGDEEFAVILPDTPQTGARKLAEILLQRARFCDVTLSIGMVTVNPLQSEFRDLLDTAMHALQQAKQSGGNCLAIG